MKNTPALATVRSRFLLTLSFCLLVLQPGAAIAASEGSPEVSPTQPLDGPGGASYFHGNAQVTSFAPSATTLGYTLFEPTTPAPKSAPLVVYLMGDFPVALEPSVSSSVYAAMLRHMARKGYLVLFISNKFPETAGKHVLDSAPQMVLNTIRTAAGRQQGKATVPATSAEGLQWAIGGHSRGGLIGFLVANRHREVGLTPPKALLLHESNTPDTVRSVCLNPGFTYALCGYSFPTATENLPASTRLLMIRSYESDALPISGGDPRPYTAGSVHAYADLWRRTSIAEPNTHFFYVQRAEHQGAVVESAHISVMSTLLPLPAFLEGLFRKFLGATVSGPDRVDWFAFWKPTVATLDVAFRREGNGVQYLDDTSPAATEMGTWADGTPVPPLLTKRDFRQFFVRQNFQLPRGAVAIFPTFPAAKFQSSETIQFKLSNEGQKPAVVASIAVSGAGFALEGSSSACTKSLAEKEVCAFFVRYTGTQKSSGNLSVSYVSDGSTTTVNRVLNGLPK